MRLAYTSMMVALCLGTSFATTANTISGQVKDENGNALKKGYVQIMGTNKRTSIDENGRFEFTAVKPGLVELHVSSINHIHSSEKVTVIADEVVAVDIQVDASSIEVFDVTASAFHASNIESAAPVSILAGEKLKQQQASTLGETLKNQVGVHSSFYGGVTSSPIIRGLDGPRVLITQNGMDASDASRVGPDHLVATESSTVQQIEVLRGPATLFYGSGAIGGVVNMVDTRVPTDNLTEGEATVSRSTNNSEEAFSGSYKTGNDNFAFQVLGFYRDSDDYRIPGYAEDESAHSDHDDDHDDDHGDEHEDEHEEGSFGVVENTAARTQGLTVGGSYLFDEGHVGFAVEHFSSVYGIPGHAHGEEEHADHDEDHDGDDHDEMIEEEIVMADLQQNRYQLSGDFQLNSALVSAVNFGISYTDYEHTELENQVPGTRFANETFETRIEVLHQPLNGWRGGFSLHTKMTDFSAIGEEAFTPPSDTKSFGLGLIEEKHFGDWLVQLGARVERVNIDVPSVFAPELELHEEGEEHHDEGEHDDGDHDEHEHSDMPIDAVGLSFTPISLSAGVVWDIAKGYNMAFSYVHAKRAPSAAELFSFGPHIGTQSYEIGALYQLDGEEFEFDGSKPNMEVSNNIDISWRKFGGDFGVIFNLFYNQIDDYYYAANTGFEAEFEHAHEDEHDEDHGDEHDDMDMDDDHDEEGHEEEGLPVFAYVAADADLYGAEIQVSYNVTNNLTLMAQGDYIRAKVKQSDTGNLPRIPPVKTIFSADYKTDNFSVLGQITHMFAQSDIAEFESETDAYTLVDMNASYYTSVLNTPTEIFVRGRNLLDEEARVHTSFLKDLAPLQGRSVEIGIRMNF
jgi:iron complex outermembrane receptor protein